MSAAVVSDQSPSASVVEDETVLGKVTHCQACFNINLTQVIDFGAQPPVQAYLHAEQLGQPETTYPLGLLRCPKCGLVQLSYVADPHVVFPKDYSYQTAMTRILRENFEELAQTAVTRLGLRSGDLAIDIGCNDGTLLQRFQSRGLRALGVDPTDVALVARGNGVIAIQEFFSEDVATSIRHEHGQAAIVTATNVFAHVNRLYSVLRGISLLLPDGGTFVSESGYLLDIVQTFQYDTIYHDHLRHYSLKPMQRLLHRAGFTLVDAERVPTHGGSIRVWAKKGTHHAAAPRLADLLQHEEECGLYDPQTYVQFRQRVLDARLKLQRLLLQIKAEGKRIVGVGAPARSSMLLNYNHIDFDVVDYIVEPAGSLKVGLWTPGTRIPVLDESHLLNDQPDYLLLLSWHLGEELVTKLRAKGLRSAFVIPLPEPRIIAAT